MLKFILGDGFGTGNKAKVNGEGEVSVIVHPHPPFDEFSIPTPFRQFFSDDGTSTGTTDMRVNGATTNQEFFIKAIKNKDLYIKTVSILIADANATLNRFGFLTALTNGVKFEWISQQLGTVTIADALQTNFDFVRLAIGAPPFGDATSAFQAGNVSGTSEGYLPTIDFAKVFGTPWGLRLRKDSTDKLVFTIRDDVSGVDAFNAIGYGIQF